MYLAPLNFNRFFKKVFRDLEVAKKFLEDFLDIEIEMIEKLESSHRVTDDSVLVEFDFRCKIDGNYVIVDMQQWFKPDVSHRFYLYHTLATALQLEDLPLKSIVLDKKTGKEKKVKDYRFLEPVITIVWMVDDVLGNKEDILAYRMFPEDLSRFLNDSELWTKRSMKKLLEERETVSKKMKNNAKGLDFIPKNRLIFAFQKNIIKNKKINKYIRWFELAAKTRKKENKAADFLQFEKDSEFKSIYQKIKKRLIRKNLKEDELEYITEETIRQEQIQRSIDGYISDRESELEWEMKVALEEKDKALEEKDAVIEENQKALEEKERALEENKAAIEENQKSLRNAVKALMERGVSEEDAKKIVGI